VAIGGGSGSGNSIFQTNAFITNGQVYTVSFWYIPPIPATRTLTVRLTGADPGDPVLQDYETPTSPSGIRRRLDTLHGVNFETGIENKDNLGGGMLEDLRDLIVLDAVRSNQQL